MSTPRYDTTAGQVTYDNTYQKLIHHLDEAANCAVILSHLRNTEQSEMSVLAAKGWLGVSELLSRARTQIIKMAAAKFIN